MNFEGLLGKAACLITLISSKKIIDSRSLPEEIEGIAYLASNFYFSWDSQLRAVFEEIDPDLWEKSSHNPLLFLKQIPQRRLEELESDSEFISRLQSAVRAQEEYLSSDSKWFNIAYSGKNEG